MWQPGQRYIQFPRYKVSLGSKYPTFEVSYNKGVKSIWAVMLILTNGSYRCLINMNFKLVENCVTASALVDLSTPIKLRYPIFQHFNGNRVYSNKKYLNSFQLAFLLPI
jgi:hypothetical protein